MRKDGAGQYQLRLVFLRKPGLSATLNPGFALYSGVPSAHADFVSAYSAPFMMDRMMLPLLENGASVDASMSSEISSIGTMVNTSGTTAKIA